MSRRGHGRGQGRQLTLPTDPHARIIALGILSLLAGVFALHEIKEARSRPPSWVVTDLVILGPIVLGLWGALLHDVGYAWTYGSAALKRKLEAEAHE